MLYLKQETEYFLSTVYISQKKKKKKKETRGPLVLYRSPDSRGYVKISGYWGKEV